MSNLEIRLLALEERLLLATIYYKNPELDVLCIPSIRSALSDPDRVHQINEILTQTRVPVLTSELSEEELETLRTGKRVAPKPARKQEDAPPSPLPSEQNWRDLLDEMVAKNPELDFVHFMLYHFLQPANIREIHRPLLKKSALGLHYKNKLYRVVGVTPFGTLQLTTALKQDLVYETTLPFTETLNGGEWVRLSEKG